MRYRLTIWFGCWLLIFSGHLWAQKTSAGAVWMAGWQPVIVEMPRYANALPAGQTVLKMAFAGAKIRNPQACTSRKGPVEQVDIVLTRYPRALESWEIGYDALMQRRLRALFALAPALQTQANLRWRIVLQTDCQDLATAQQMLHGIVLYHGPSGEAVSTDMIDTAATDSLRPIRFAEGRLRANFELITRIVAGEAEYHDSTALFVMDRHPEWKDMLVVVDWTASMYQHGALLVRWQQQQTESPVRHFVFFNDGDGKYDDEKEGGATGGIYGTEGVSPEEVAEVMEAVSLGGEGGDHRENDLEALVFGLNEYFDFEEVVLVADNDGPVRDMQQLLDIDRPVRIILSSVYKDNLRADYLTIAHYSKGSIHTKDADFTDIAGMMKQGQLELGGNIYELQGKRFVKKRKEW